MVLICQRYDYFMIIAEGKSDIYTTQRGALS